MTFPRFTLHDDGSVTFDEAPVPRLPRGELASDGPASAGVRTHHGDVGLTTLRAVLGFGRPPDMRGKSFSPWQPLMQDLAWSVLFVLAPERAPGGQLTTRSTTEQVTIERGMTAPVDRSASTWADGDARLSVELDESWWNEHTLANSFLRAVVAIGARQVRLFFDEEGTLRWTSTNLSEHELAKVITLLGQPFVAGAQSNKPT